MLYDPSDGAEWDVLDILRLNAPFGARCFMTEKNADGDILITWGLNAPFGARCFMTGCRAATRRPGSFVLMHRLVLGAL